MVTEPNYLIAHPVRKHTNMGLPVVQPQFALEPDIDLPFFHVPDLLQMFQRTVSQNSLVPEIPICQSPHRPVRPAVGAYIGITGRPAITKIDIFALGAAATAIDGAGWPKRSVSMAIGTFDLFLLRHKNHHLQMRIDDGAKASFSVKTILIAARVQRKLSERTGGRVWCVPFDVLGKGSVKGAPGQNGDALRRIHSFSG